MNFEQESMVQQAIATWEKERSLIINFLETRRIPKIFHFTPIENLASILELGILSRQKLIDEGIKFKPTDDLRLDGLPSGICFSISTPNMGLLKQKRNLAQNSIAVLECATHTLISFPFISFPGNAASSAFAEDKTENFHRYIGVEGLKNLFLNQEIRNRNGIAINQPTDNQSEIIFLETISNDRILKIHLPNQLDATLEKSIAEIDPTNIGLDFHKPCNCNFFSNNSPYIGAGRFSFDWFTS